MIRIKSYIFGLSWVGVLAVILVMLPNATYLFYAPLNDVLSNNEAGYWLWNILENIGRYGLMIALCFIINKTAPTQNRAIAIVAICSLFAYYALWIAYFMGWFNGLSLVGMAVFPALFFLLTSWRQKNVFALALAALFGLCHIAITSSNFMF